MSEHSNGERDNMEADEDPEQLIEVIDLDEMFPNDGEAEDEEELPSEDSGNEEPQEPGEPEVTFAGVDGVTTVEPINTFLHHNGSVFCLATDDITGSIVVSGGEDDAAFVWKLENGEVRFVCEGHKDSVIQVGVSHDAVYVFSADMSGLIKVWKTDDGQEVWSTETSDLKWARWHTKAHVLFAGTDDGTFYMWQIPLGHCKVHQVSGSMSATQLFPDGKRICFTHAGGAITVFDLKDWKVINNLAGRSNSDEFEILSLDINPEGTLIASGNVSGAVRIFNAQTIKSVWDIDEPLFASAKEDDRAIEAVAFSKTHPWLLVAGLNGNFCVYDIPTQTKRHSGFNASLAGITKMVLIPKSGSFLLAHVHGALSIWDARAGTLQMVLYGKQDQILDVVVSADGLNVLASSNDGAVCVFQTQNS